VNAGSSGNYAKFQQYEYNRYQPGKSTTINLSFVMGTSSSGVTKYIGYSDGVNGIELLMVDGVAQFAVLSSTTIGNTYVRQTLWNVDAFDSTGPSGCNIDFTKCQILCIDFQALYAGRIRIGFNIGGVVHCAHEFNHANIIAVPYFANASLPIRAGIETTSAISTPDSFKLLCCSVMSEGGQATLVGYEFSSKVAITVGNGVPTHAFSIRPLSTFKTQTNRVQVKIESVEIAVTGTNAVEYDLVFGQLLTSATWSPTNAEYSACEFSTGGTLSGLPSITVESGTVSSSAQNKGIIDRTVYMRYPITLDATGSHRDLGTYTVLVSGVGGTSSVRCVVNWREIR